MSDNNDSIDKLAELYASDDEDQIVFQKAQQATIIAQTRQINEYRRKFEELSKQVQELTIENTRLKATTGSPNVDKEDAETIAMVQLALLRSYAMQRELTLEETKKFEIYTKTMVLIRGKSAQDEQASIGSLSDEDLLKALKEI